MKVVATQYIAAGEAVIVDAGLVRPAFEREHGAVATAVEAIAKGDVIIYDPSTRTIKRALPK